MNSRAAISALFILIAAMVVASRGTSLLEKLRVFGASCANKISEVRSVPLVDHSDTYRNPARAAGSISPDAQAVPFNFSQATHFLGSHARRLERCVLSVAHLDHPGE